MSFQPITTHGHDLYEVVSSLQKEIRRGDKYKAVYWALEMYNSNFIKYLWERLLVISAEDIDNPLSHLIVKSLYESFENVQKGERKHRIFMTRAVLHLCEADKNRNADHFQNLVDKKIELGQMLEIPPYAKDVHTRAGKMMGKTKKDFFESEYKALQPVKEDEQDKKAVEQLLLFL